MSIEETLVVYHSRPDTRHCDGHNRSFLACYGALPAFWNCSGQAGSYGLTYGVVAAVASVESWDDEMIRFYTNTASAYDDGDAAYSGYAFGNVRGWDNVGRAYEMRRTHTN